MVHVSINICNDCYIIKYIVLCNRKHGEKDNHLVLMLVVGGCVSLILIAIIVSVSILAIYRQRLNNSITNKIIMRGGCNSTHNNHHFLLTVNPTHRLASLFCNWRPFSSWNFFMTGFQKLNMKDAIKKMVKLNLVKR